MTSQNAGTPKLSAVERTCAVDGCTMPIWGPNNLCDEHLLPGIAGITNGRAFVVTAWAVEHAGEVGIIFLNDWALGTYFGGRAGFEAQLAVQGFVQVRNLATPGELEAAKRPSKGKKFGYWSGPWRTQYPWEKCNEYQPN